MNTITMSNKNDNVIDNTRCKSCLYSRIIYSGGRQEKEYICYYIVVEHQRRGCPVGDQCTRYEPKESK